MKSEDIRKLIEPSTYSPGLTAECRLTADKQTRDEQTRDKQTSRQGASRRADKLFHIRAYQAHLAH